MKRVLFLSALLGLELGLLLGRPSLLNAVMTIWVLVLWSFTVTQRAESKTMPFIQMTKDTTDEEITAYVDHICRLLFETREPFPYSRQEMFQLLRYKRDKLKERDV